MEIHVGKHSVVPNIELRKVLAEALKPEAQREKPHETLQNTGYIATHALEAYQVISFLALIPRRLNPLKIKTSMLWLK